MTTIKIYLSMLSLNLDEFKRLSPFELFTLFVALICSIVIVWVIGYIVFSLLAIVFNFFHLVSIDILWRSAVAYALIYIPSQWVNPYLNDIRLSQLRKRK